MIHIMITVPVALSFCAFESYHAKIADFVCMIIVSYGGWNVDLGPFGFGTFNTLCPLGIFVILGIGADDVFIVVVSPSRTQP